MKTEKEHQVQVSVDGAHMLTTEQTHPKRQGYGTHAPRQACHLSHTQKGPGASLPEPLGLRGRGRPRRGQVQHHAQRVHAEAPQGWRL